MSARSITQRLDLTGELVPWDSAASFLVKSLLYPVGAVGSLVLSLAICGQGFRKAYFLTAVLAFLATSDLFSVTPLHMLATRHAFLRAYLAITGRWFVVITILWGLVSISGQQPNLTPQVWLTWALVTPTVLLLSGIGAQRAFGLAAAAQRNRSRKAIIVGLNDLSRTLEKCIAEDRSHHVQVLGHFDEPGVQADNPEGLLGNTGNLREFIQNNDVSIVYVTWPMTREPRVLDLMDVLRDSTASIYFVPDVSITNSIQARVALVNGMPVVGVCESPFYGFRALQKRGLDLALSALIILLAAPLLTLLALGVRLSSPGPILFRQRRYGLDGRLFYVYKFRTMRVTEDGSDTFAAAQRDDPRITPFGAFLRRYSLDELPQLFNVLFGDMSLVGPRPHVVAMNEAYRRLISGYMLRHKVRPGITGWAQVNGSRGGNDLESMRRRLDLDLEYLKHWSLRLDLEILARTIALVWRDESAY